MWSVNFYKGLTIIQKSTISFDQTIADYAES